MENINLIENSIRAFENISGLKITVVDNAGIFHTNKGSVIFNHFRQSHRKNLVCYIGFCKKCVAHCRYEMNSVCAKKREAFVETCWKGITEIVVPLQQNEIHYGMLYAGSWRRKDISPPSGLPKKFYDAYESLPFLPDEARINELKTLLTVLASGILNILNELNAFDAIPDTRGNRIKTFIRNRAVEKVELADLAAHLGLSCSRTSFLVKDILNKTFPELLNEERLRRVETLLLTSNMTLAEIAVQTGLTDEYYLSKIFKKQNGQTPGQYRKLHKNKMEWGRKRPVPTEDVYDSREEF